MTEPEPGPRRAPAYMVVVSAAITLYFLWVLLFAREGQPMLLVILYVLAVIANLAFLISVFNRWRGGRSS
jgi:hypothetical protein